jgi:hypothetical protein
MSADPTPFGLLVGIFILLSTLSILLSWVAYMPMFMRLLKKEAPEEFRKLNSQFWFFGVSAGRPFIYFLLGHYRRAENSRITFHGSILRYSFSYTLLIAPLIAFGLFLFDQRP